MALNNPLHHKKILITCGPTWAPIDSVRVISNISTGQIGHLIARECLKQKAQVTLLEGPIRQNFPLKKIKLLKFSYYNELLSLLKKELKKGYHIVIHAAAVSDYQLRKVFAVKINSKGKKLKLNLIPTQKMINLIKRIDPGVFLVGFKLESKLSRQLAIHKTRGLFNQAKCDLAFINTLKNKAYKGFIINKDGSILARGQSRQNIAKQLVKNISDKI